MGGPIQINPSTNASTAIINFVPKFVFTFAIVNEILFLILFFFFLILKCYESKMIQLILSCATNNSNSNSWSEFVENSILIFIIFLFLFCLLFFAFHFDRFIEM